MKVVLINFLKKYSFQAKGQFGPNLAWNYSTLYPWFIRVLFWTILVHNVQKIWSPFYRHPPPPPTICLSLLFIFFLDPPLLVRIFWQYRPNEIPDEHKTNFMWQSSFFFFRKLRKNVTCVFIKKLWEATPGLDLIQDNNDLNYQKYQTFYLKYFVKTLSKEHYCYKIHMLLMKSSAGHPPLYVTSPSIHQSVRQELSQEPYIMWY